MNKCFILIHILYEFKDISEITWIKFNVFPTYIKHFNSKWLVQTIWIVACITFQTIQTLSYLIFVSALLMITLSKWIMCYVTKCNNTFYCHVCEYFNTMCRSNEEKPSVITDSIAIDIVTDVSVYHINLLSSKPSLKHMSMHSIVY